MISHHRVLWLHRHSVRNGLRDLHEGRVHLRLLEKLLWGHHLLLRHCRLMHCLVLNHSMLLRGLHAMRIHGR